LCTPASMPYFRQAKSRTSSCLYERMGLDWFFIFSFSSYGSVSSSPSVTGKAFIANMYKWVNITAKLTFYSIDGVCAHWVFELVDLRPQVTDDPRKPFGFPFFFLHALGVAQLSLRRGAWCATWCSSCISHRHNLPPWCLRCSCRCPWRRAARCLRHLPRRFGLLRR
jgi:hypothetical protein